MFIDIGGKLGLTPPYGREEKGSSLLSLLDDYVIVDLETTGYEYHWDDIIEIGAIRYRKDAEVARFHSFVSVSFPLSEFVVAHTGITDEMLLGAPKIVEILPRLLDFIGTDTVVAHNANFDVNFIYDNAFGHLGTPFRNDFVDTMRLAKKCALSVPNHKLETLAQEFGIRQETAHRSIADCETTHALYNKLKEYITQHDISLKPKYYHSRIAGTQANTDEIDPDNPFYGKTVAFTGALDSMQRKDAAQLVANLGGILSDGVSKNTNFLVLGNTAYCANIKDGKSSKFKKAEQLILKGQDLQIISENTFLTMVTEQ